MRKEAIELAKKEAKIAEFKSVTFECPNEDYAKRTAGLMNAGCGKYLFMIANAIRAGCGVGHYLGLDREEYLREGGVQLEDTLRGFKSRKFAEEFVNIKLTLKKNPEERDFLLRYLEYLKEDSDRLPCFGDIEKIEPHPTASRFYLKGKNSRVIGMGNCNFTDIDGTIDPESIEFKYLKKEKIDEETDLKLEIYLDSSFIIYTTKGNFIAAKIGSDPSFQKEIECDKSKVISPIEEPHQEHLCSSFLQSNPEIIKTRDDILEIALKSSALGLQKHFFSSNDQSREFLQQAKKTFTEATNITINSANLEEYHTLDDFYNFGKHKRKFDTGVVECAKALEDGFRKGDDVEYYLGLKPSKAESKTPSDVATAKTAMNESAVEKKKPCLKK